jgi:hypothetical protein
MAKSNNKFTIFGYEIQKRIQQQTDNEDLKNKDITSFIPKDNDLGDVSTVSAGGFFGQYYDISGTENSNTEKQFIYKYREAAEQPEVDSAISDIVDEAIASLENGPPVKIVLDELEYDDPIKTKIRKEFYEVLRMLNFSENGPDIFRRWYIDGRIYYHVVVDRNNAKDGIAELRYIDPTKIKKIKEVKESVDPKTGVKLSEVVEEYYMYSEEFVSATGSSITYSAGNSSNIGGIKIAKEAIIEVHSGLMDAQRKKRLSYLHKALKVINQLRIMEDALVIYRLARAPERRIFYIDTGNLPAGKSEEYVRRMMSQFRNKIVYDVKTGEVKDERRHMSMLEDFFIPRREGSQGTEISTLPGGENLGQIDDILYFKTQLYKSLNIPVTRIDPDSAFPGGSGRATEITRDEVKFQKFINRLRKKFSYLLLDCLKIQLQLKGIVSESDWNDIVQDITIDFIQDNHFYETKEFEILQEKLNALSSIGDHIGNYFSKAWVRKNILRMSDDEIEYMDKEIADEKSKEPKPDDQFGM